MAVKSVVLSDISGVELTDETHVRIHVRHPDFGQTLELDMSAEEASKLVDSPLRLVNFTVFAPNAPAREVVAETKIIDKLFSNFDEVLRGARKVEQRPSENGQRKARSTAPKASTDKIDPTAPDQYGRLRRGRLTEAEKELVRANREQASKNREAQGHPPIDWTDAKERERYGITD